MEFTAVVQLHGKSATGMEIPADIVERLGGGRRPLIQVTINGHTYPSAIGIMGGKSLIPLSADNRRKAGVAAGDRVKVSVELDTAPRDVEIPTDFDKALTAHPVAKEAFRQLSSSGKKRHILSIEGAKTEETRQRRIAKAVTELEGSLP